MKKLRNERKEKKIKIKRGKKTTKIIKLNLDNKKSL